MALFNSSRPVSVHDIRQFTARETSNARKVIAATKLARWYRNAQLRKYARVRLSLQRAYYRGLIRMIFMRWIRYFRILKISRTRIYRYIFDHWRESIKETIASLHYYERKLIARIFSFWRMDPGSRICYMELLTKDKGPDPHVKQHLEMLRLRNILLFWRARQILSKCLNIGLELTVSIDVVASKVPQSSSSSIWKGYLCYLNSFQTIESSIFSRLSARLLRDSFTNWKHKAITILRRNNLELRVRKLELRWLRPFFKSWVLFHRTRTYILDRAIVRWQLILSVHIRHTEAVRAALELRKYMLKRSHFNSWTRYIFARELHARHHCLEKVYGIADNSHERSFVCSNWLKYALFFVHSLLKDYSPQATAFKCLRRLKYAVDAPRCWQRLTILAHVTYYTSRLRLYLRAWAFVAFKMKTIEKKQKSFCAIDDIVFQSADIKLLHDKHNAELACPESLFLMGLISKNSEIQPHRLGILCKGDKYNCLLLMKLRKYISCQPPKVIHCLYSGLHDSDVIANVDRLLLKFSIVAMTRLGSYNAYYIETYQNESALKLEDPVQYRQAMGLVQRHLAIRYHEFLAAADLLYSELYTNGVQSSSEKRIAAYISGKFPHIKKALDTESVVLLTTAFLLETPAIVFTDRRSVISSSFLLQTWMGHRQSYVSQERDGPHREELFQPIAADSISIVDNVYFTGLSRDFNAKGVTMLLSPTVFPADNSITAAERASLCTQLEVIKSKRFSVSSEAECWLLGAIASASERELQLSAIYRRKLYLRQTSRLLASPIRQSSLQLAPLDDLDDDANSVSVTLEEEPIDVIQLFRYARSIQVDRFTTTLISTGATRVTVDEMKRLVETVRTSVVHPSLLTYINAKAPEGEIPTTIEVAVSVELKPLTRSFDEVLELEKNATNAAMRIIERSFSIAPLSQVNTGSFCMLPDEQLINSSDLSFLQSSQLLSRQNSYVSPSFEQYSRLTGQHLEPRNSIKNPTHVDKSRRSSSKKKSRHKSGSLSAHATAKQKKSKSSHGIIKSEQSRACRTAGFPNKQQPRAHKVIEKECSFYSHDSSASYQTLNTGSFHVHSSDDAYNDASHEVAHIQALVHVPCNTDTSEPMATPHLRSSYYSSIADGRLSSGRAFLGKLSSRPQTTVPYLTRRINNSQRSSDTESSDDIKFQKQHRVASAISYGTHIKQKHELGGHNTDSSIATTASTTTYVDAALPTRQFIEAQLTSGQFTLGLLTRYQRTLLALHIWKKSSYCSAYILSESITSIPEMDLRFYALSSGRAVLSLDTIIDTILYDNIMLLYDNEDPDEVFREIWLTDPQFMDVNTQNNATPTSSIVQLHFARFWDYIKMLSDEYIYEIAYEGDCALGDKVMRSIRSAPIFYGKMLRCSVAETANIASSLAEVATSSLLYKASFLSSARSRSGTAAFSQMTLDDLSADLVFRQSAHYNRFLEKPITAPPCTFLPTTQKRRLSELVTSQLSSSRPSPRPIYSVVNMSLCDDNVVAVSISSPHPWSREGSHPPAGSFAEATSPRPESQSHNWVYRGYLSYTPKMAHLAVDTDIVSVPSASRYLRSSSTPSKMTILQPLNHLTIDESLLTVKAEPELPLTVPEIKPFLISNSVTERFTITIHKTREISPSGIKRMQSGRIGALAYSESRGVLLPQSMSKSTIDKTPSLTGVLSDNRVDSLTPLDDALDRELRSATCNVKNKLCGIIEGDAEPFSDHKKQGSFKSSPNLCDGLIVHKWGDMHLTEQKDTKTCNISEHTRATSSPQLNFHGESPSCTTKRIVKIGNNYSSIASFTEASLTLRHLSMIQAHDQPYTYKQVDVYQPRVSKSVQRDRSPNRPSSGLKVFCSSLQEPEHKASETEYIYRENKILIERITPLPSTDQLIERMGPAIPSLMVPVSNQEDFSDLKLPLGDIEEPCKHISRHNNPISFQINLDDTVDTLYKDMYRNTVLSHGLEAVSITNDKVAEHPAAENFSSRCPQMKTQLQRILSRGSQESARHAINALKKDQVVLNAKRNYRQCLFNKSVNFKQKTFNSILRPKEIDQEYEELREKVKSRVGSRAPSRLSSRGDFDSCKSSSPLRPLLTSPGRRRENLLVITMDPPVQVETTTDEMESTDIGIRINERLFGIDYVC
ncbi:Hypothetical protein GLP15_4458 [Giardia lamblia P15]|uniref:Uncharacterized protein n=1 Tax=Giardia intestinalis (strain P15) TaxID=658858 RepID=E1F5M5_GIAIA|nr:Hypothetical protein GLP15_4458 [Giardia lamblia P15]